MHLPSLSKSSKFILIFGILLVLLSAFFIYFYSQRINNNPRQRSTIVTQDNEYQWPEISVDSEISGINISSADTSEEWFRQAFDAMQFDPSEGFSSLTENIRYFPNKVSFVYKDIEPLSTEEREVLFYAVRSGGEIVAGLGMQNIGTEVEYEIYLDIDPGLYQDNEEGLVNDLSFHLLKAIYAANNYEFKKFEMVSETREELAGSSDQPFEAEISPVSGMLQSFTNILSNMIVGEVYAAYPPNCADNYIECGRWVQDCSCPHDGSSCSTPLSTGECGNQSRCSCSSDLTCVAGGGGGLVGGCNGDNYGTCESPSCGGSYCVFSGSCTYTPLPTTEPGLPTPTPGSACDCTWGCYDVSDPARECIPNSDCPGGWACRDSCGCPDNGGGGCTKSRVIGRVYDAHTGTHRYWQPANDDGGSFSCGSYPTDPDGEDPDDGVGLRIENSNGGHGDWNCNEGGPFYDRRAADCGAGPHDFYLTTPASYDCSNVDWHISYPLGYSHSSFPANPAGGPDCYQNGAGHWVCTGTGCTATVYLSPDDWGNSLSWRMGLGVSCTVSVPGNISVPLGSTRQYPVTIDATAGYTVDSVTMTVDDTTIASLDPVNPDPAILDVEVEGLSFGSTTAYGECTLAGVTDPMPAPIPGNINVTSPGPWWQVLGGSIWANDGNVQSNVPGASTAYLLEDLTDIVDAGIAVAVDGTVDDPVSDDNLLVELPSSYTYTSSYNFAYFFDRLDPASGNELPSANITEAHLEACDTYKDTDYILCHYSNPATLGDGTEIDLDNNKIILLVDGNLQVNSDVKVDDGLGFFMLIANGDITIAGGVGNAVGDTEPHLEGYYLAMDDFITPANASGDLQLRVRGAVTALNENTGDGDDGFVLLRVFSNNLTGPTEVFIPAPDLELRFPSFLSQRFVTWTEVAP